MSLILQGIDLPKDGKTITVDIDSNGVAWVSNKGEWDKHQAIQIPKGHGRLIDADALETVFEDMAKCEWNQKVSPISWVYAFESTIDEIADAPTILGSEE